MFKISDLLKMIPTPYKILGAVLIVLGIVGVIFSYGYSKGIQKADDKIAAYEQSYQQKINKINEGQIKINDKVITKYVDKVHTIYLEKEKTDEIITQIPTQELSAGAIFGHNLSAGYSVRVDNTSYKGYNADSSRATDETASGITTNSALSVINGNYSTCKANEEQLIALQNWIRESQKNVEEANSKSNKKKKSNND